MIMGTIVQCTIGSISLTCEEFEVQKSVLGSSIRDIGDRRLHG